MKMNMNNKKGFTITEVVVTSCIIAILSGIGVPIYNGYINDAKQGEIENLAEVSSAAANSYVRKIGEESLTVEALELHYDSEKYEISIDTDKNEITVKGYGITHTVAYQ